MALTNEQASEIKEQLLKQLERFPEDKRDQIKSQVEAMTAEQVEAFVKQNELGHLGNQCIFCNIVSGNSPSIKIAENKDNLAILEINPLSKGHTLIVPKNHSEKIFQSAEDLARDIEVKLKEKFSPKEVKIEGLNITGHSILEVIPIYGDENQRKKASEEELLKIKEELISIPEKLPEKEIIKEPIKEETKEVIKLKPRIP